MPPAAYAATARSSSAAGELHRIEAAIGAAGEARDLAKSLFGDRIVAFLEHEGRNAEQPERTGRMAKIVELLLHRVADEDQCLHLLLLRLAAAHAQ